MLLSFSAGIRELALARWNVQRISQSDKVACRINIVRTLYLFDYFIYRIHIFRFNKWLC